jgi:hypothetical protein
VKVRGTTLGVKLTVLCWGALTLLAPVALTACSSSSSSTPSPSVFTPSVSISGTASVTASVTASASAGNSGNTPSAGSGTTTPGTPGVTSTATATISPRATRTVTPTPVATVTETHSPVPVAAPVTGGGGTAGFQDALLLVAGLAAIVAGAGSIFYRRRLTRHR